MHYFHFLKYIAVSFFLSLVFFCSHTYAAITITEVMYDPQGTEGEWIEVYNDGTDTVDLKNWKFYDGVNHTIPAGVVIPPSSYAILADNKTTFIASYPSLSSVTFDIVTSLNNDGEALVALRNAAGVDVSTMSYSATAGASKNGKSLQKAGSLWAPAPATPGVQNTLTEEEAKIINASLTNPVNANATSSSNTSTVTSSPAQTIANTSGSYRPWPASYQIYVSGGGNRTVFAGAPVLFEGKLISAVGISLPSATLIWSFGDGAQDSGRSVYHSFAYPGEYAVTIEAVYGEFLAEDRAVIKVIPPSIEISNASFDETPYIELFNSSHDDIDLSGWILEVDGPLGRHFVIPKYTRILAHRKVIFPSSITKLFPTTKEIRLLFPNTVLLTEYGFKKDLGVATTTAHSMATSVIVTDTELQTQEEVEVLQIVKDVDSSSELHSPPVVSVEQRKTESGTTTTGDVYNKTASLGVLGYSGVRASALFISVLFFSIVLLIYIAKYLEKFEKGHSGIIKEAEEIIIIE